MPTSSDLNEMAKIYSNQLAEGFSKNVANSDEEKTSMPQEILTRMNGAKPDPEEAFDNEAYLEKHRANRIMSKNPIDPNSPGLLKSMEGPTGADGMPTMAHLFAKRKGKPSQEKRRKAKRRAQNKARQKSRK